MAMAIASPKLIQTDVAAPQENLMTSPPLTEPASSEPASAKPAPRLRRYRNAPVDRAAGGVVLHQGHVLVVHRPRYDDWSLPKGHVNRGETWQQTAIREVHEETGVNPVIVSEPYPVSYLIKQNVPKLVVFFAMRCQNERGELLDELLDERPSELAGDPAEVDQVQWWSIAEATRRLDYAVESEALTALVALADPASPDEASPDEASPDQADPDEAASGSANGKNACNKNACNKNAYSKRRR